MRLARYAQGSAISILLLAFVLALAGCPPEETPPTAAFTAAPTSGTAPLAVQFNDFSTPGSASITSWSWNFGDGGTSTQPSPNHLYTTAGVYTVSLTVSTSAGTDTETKTGYITVNSATGGPTANFSATPRSGNAPLQAQFTDTSSAGSAAITAWSWNFGDGSTSTQQNPSHLYTAAGTYTVSLTVTTSVSSDTETKSGYITVGAAPTGPAAEFSGTPRSGTVPLQVQFTDTSAPGSASITAWSWNFGDGSTSTQQNPSHTYTTAANCTVSLTVTTSLSSDTETKTNYITAEAPPVIQLQLVKWALETGAPNYVNILFQALDSEGIGVTDLSTEDFKVRENSEDVSPTESNAEVKKQDRLPYRFDTVLMLDNSASVGANLASIRTAAKTLVNGMGAKQRIAVYSFSDSITSVIGFTGITGKQSILNAIDTIQLGFPTTNLYGAAIAGVGQWTDQYQLSGIIQGALVLLTDGSDTQASSTLEQALNARGSKRCYTISLGAEINPAALQSLGNAGYYPLADFTQLAATFAQIQADIDAYANSFYFLRYNSPKRGSNTHNLSLFSVSPYQSNTLTGSFNSGPFYSVMPGVYVNDGYLDHDGISELDMNQGIDQQVTLQVHTYFGTPGIDPVYTCTSTDEGVVRVMSINGGQIKIEAVYPGTATLTILDTTNDFETTIDVTVAAIVPNVYNQPEDEAVAAIEAAGLSAGTVTEAYSLDVEAGHVINTSPSAGSVVAPGTVVDLTVSLGEYVPVEDTVLLPGDIPLILIFIPPGTFQMGRYSGEQDSYSNEDPQHLVTVSGFWMGKYEVTQAQWHAITGSNPSYFSGDNRPVEQVSWNDITQTFLPALNTATGLTFRLPSEAEWEYACRAGTTTRFYWGDDPTYSQIGNYAWYSNNSSSATHDVGGKLPNAFGLYDMSGNVWEWCQDYWHENYTGAPTNGSAWVSPAGMYRVLRGGSWTFNYGCRSATRHNSLPDIQNLYNGFRLLRTP